MRGTFSIIQRKTGFFNDDTVKSAEKICRKVSEKQNKKQKEADAK